MLTFVVISNFSTGYLLSFCAVLLHELGHLSAMFICKNLPDGLAISAFDIKIIKYNRYRQSFCKDIFITSAGVLINFILFVIFYKFLINFAFVNLFVGIFNLLPASNLDGGQLLLLLLSKQFAWDTSQKIVDIITFALSFPLFLLGSLVLFNSKYNFSLLIISVYLILSIFFKKDKVL